MYPALGGSEGGPNGMPVIADGVVYGLGAKGDLFAVSLADGKGLWSLRIDEKLGARPARFGFSTVPLVAGDVLFVQAGGDAGRSLAGIDRRTGAVRWTTGDDGVGYQSPILATLGGVEQVVAVTNRAVLGLDASTGAVLWEHEPGLGSDDGAATPVLLGDDRFFLMGEESSKAFGVTRDASGWRVEELWSTRALKGSLATPVVHEGHLYGFDGDFLTCIDAAKGEKAWKSRPPGGRGLILVDGHLVVFANDGAVVVAEATPEGYREKARLPVADAGTYTYPSFASGRIFVRNTKELAAIAVVAGKPPVVDTAAAAEPRNAFERWVRKLEAVDSKSLHVDDFMASQPRFPIVEDDRFVHFVWRGEAEDVAITGSMTEFQAEEALARVPGTDLFWRSYAIEPGARWEYRFNVGFEELGPDPLNPLRVPGREGDLSEVATATWKRPEWRKPYEGGARGRLERIDLDSKILGGPRSVDVWLPAGYDARGSRRYPLLVVEDGLAWLEKGRLGNVLDHLVGREIAPLVVAFVHLPDNARGELGGDKSDDHLRMLTDELLPRLDASYLTIAKPDSRAVLGVGGAALMAAYAAVAHPDVFGRAAACSPRTDLPAGEKLIAAAAAPASRASKPELHIAWSRYDIRRAEWNLDFARDGRRLATTLEEAGVAVHATEVPDAAGWGGWPTRAAEMLRAIFPRQG
jgi:enterochelin esterase-like enzyme/outer membrane protein assembly factor BamB